jgi:hypothetical protein
MEEVTSYSRKSHSEELHDLSSLPNIMLLIKSIMMRWFGHVACVRDMINVCGIFMGIAEGKRPLGRPTHSWEDNVKRTLEKCCECVSLIHLVQGRTW